LVGLDGFVKVARGQYEYVFFFFDASAHAKVTSG